MNLLKFSENLRTALAVREITQQEFANYLGTTQQTVSRWVNGECEPDFSILLEICLYLDETPNDLLGFDDIPNEIISKYREISKTK